MRVLIAAPDQLLTRAGGLQTQVLRTADELSKLGCRVTFFSGCERIRAADYDLAHVFSMNLPMYFKALALRNYGLPLVFSSVMWRAGRIAAIRATVELLLRSPKQLLNDVVACRQMSAWARRILPNTQAELEWLQRAIGVDGAKCAVVPNGVDDAPVASATSPGKKPLEFAFPEFVLCVAALISRKNLDLLAEVAIESGYPLVLIGPHGDPATVEYLEKLARDSGRIQLVGPLESSDPALAEAYRRCRVFCLPSDYETPGIAALEAALTGARIVITEVGGTREYFGNHAHYVMPRSRKGLRRALTLAWQQGRHVNWQVIRSSLLNEFSWEAVARKTLQQYQHAVV